MGDNFNDRKRYHRGVYGKSADQGHRLTGRCHLSPRQGRFGAVSGQRAFGAQPVPTRGAQVSTVRPHCWALRSWRGRSPHAAPSAVRRPRPRPPTSRWCRATRYSNPSNRLPLASVRTLESPWPGHYTACRTGQSPLRTATGADYSRVSAAVCIFPQRVKNGTR